MAGRLLDQWSTYKVVKLLGDRDIIVTMGKTCLRGSRGGFYMTRHKYVTRLAGSFGEHWEVLHEGVTPGCTTPARQWCDSVQLCTKMISSEQLLCSLLPPSHRPPRLLRKTKYEYYYQRSDDFIFAIIRFFPNSHLKLEKKLLFWRIEISLHGFSNWANSDTQRPLWSPAAFQ